MKLHGVMAEFDEPAPLLAAANAAYAAGYRRFDAFSPMPIEGLAEAVGFHRTRLPLLVLIGGAVGALGGFALQYTLSVHDYPLNIGGRPLNSWPSFIVISFELAILAAAITAVVGMLTLNGLPQPYHPVFNVPSFARASRDRFFLCIEASDPQFDPDQTRLFLRGLRSLEVHDVEA